MESVTGVSRYEMPTPSSWDKIEKNVHFTCKPSLTCISLFKRTENERSYQQL